MGIAWAVAVLCSETADVTKNCLLALLSLALCSRSFVQFKRLYVERMLSRPNTCNVEESGNLT